MKRSIYPVILLIIICLLPALTFAQTEVPADPVDVPIDGGLSMLLAAGVGYAVKKGYNKRKQD